MELNRQITLENVKVTLDGEHTQLPGMNLADVHQDFIVSGQMKVGQTSYGFDYEPEDKVFLLYDGNRNFVDRFQLGSALGDAEGTMTGDRIEQLAEDAANDFIYARLFAQRVEDAANELKNGESDGFFLRRLDEELQDILGRSVEFSAKALDDLHETIVSGIESGRIVSVMNIREMLRSSEAFAA